jgi:hypothetical protein
VWQLPERRRARFAGTGHPGKVSSGQRLLGICIGGVRRNVANAATSGDIAVSLLLVSRTAEAMDKLNEFSGQFAEALFESFPWMREHARVEVRDGAERGVLVVEVTPAPIRPDCTLWVSTDGDEITVGFGMFHTHFDWLSSAEPDRDDPIGFIRDLVDDKILIEDWTKGGEWSGSSTLGQGEEPDLTKMAADNVVTIRSWSGRFDRTISYQGAG